jgi:hypothetical protein
MMKNRTMLSIHAVISVLPGLSFLMLPGMVLDPFGVDKYAETRLISEVIGTALLGLGVLLWFARDVAEADLRKGMGIAVLIGAAAGLIVPAMGPTSGILLSNWRLAMLIYTSLGVANVYLVFQKPQKMTQRSFYR